MRTFRCLLGVCAMAVASLAAAQCDYEAGSMWLGKHRWATVRRAGVTLFGIPVGAGGMDRDERAWVIANERLDVLLGHRVLSRPQNIRVGRMNGQVVVVVRNPRNVGWLDDPTLIITIDRNFERHLGRNRWDIAYYWRDLMRKWSNAGVMRSATYETDSAGRPLDPDNSWHRVPEGYAERYEPGDVDADPGGCVPGAACSSPPDSGYPPSYGGAWGVPGD